ncbi:MAG: bile acid:sodium symporter family protein [Lentimicrobium sp.]|jgi:sodium/bile acid cotransporter 7|nr:bile acid:sodium symporter family protein [Lentimicrobium sp.]
MRFKIDWFVPLLLLMIVLGRFLPGPGLMTGFFSLRTFAEVGISAIFLLYGLSLSLNTLWKGMAHWKLHLVIQLTTFLIFPAIVLAVKPFIPAGHLMELWLSVFFLAVLPSTVSSAVVMVSLAGGNVAGAVFNATLSSIAGIFIAPLWMSIFTSSNAGAGDNAEIFIKLGYQILLPLFMGLLLNNRLHFLMKRMGKYTRYFDQTVILAVVYTSFSASYRSGIFKDMGTGIILLIMLFLILLFALVNGFVLVMARRFKLSTPDLVTALFCGSTKSLMHGSAMSKVIFTTAAQGGLMLVPLLIYHSMQLVITGVMSQRFAKRLMKGQH